MVRSVKVVAALVMLLAVITPANAEAWIDLYDYSYGPNEIIWVDLGFIDFWPNVPEGIADSWMGINVRARSYIVPHGTVTGTNHQSLDPLTVCPYYVIVQPSSTSGFWDEPLGITRPQGKIGNGTYDIVIDEWENGKFDAGVDDVVATFTVSNTTALGIKLNPAITALKDPQTGVAAKEYEKWSLNRQRTKSFRNSMKWIDRLQIAANLALNVWVWQGGIEPPRYDWIVDKAVSKAMQPPKNVGIPSKNEVYEQIDMMQTATVDHWEAIKNDPPDPNFTVDIPLGPIAQTEAGSPDELDRAVVGFANLSSQQAAVLNALLKSLEKFQGARDAGNQLYAIKQTRNVARYARLAAAVATETASAANGFANSAAAIQEDFGAAHARLVELQSRLHPDGTGFNSAELVALQGIGLAPSDYSTLAQSILSDSFSSEPIAELLESTSSIVSNAAASEQQLISLAQSAEQEATEWLPLVTPFPITNAGGPYTGAVGSPVALSASSTTDADTLSQSLSFAWDTDCDGQFDDAVGSTPQFTYSRAYNGLVGVRVQDPDGNSDIAYARIQVQAVNSPPSVNQKPSSLRLVAVPQQVIHLSIEVSDDDNDPLQITWKLDGNTVATGSLTCDYTPTSAQSGLHLVTAVVSDDDPSSPDGLAEWMIMVSPIPQVTLSTSFLSFGQVPPGSESTESIRVTNSGAAPLEISAPSIRSGGASDFEAVSPSIPTIISPGDSVDVLIRFRPSVPGYKGAIVEFRTNDFANQLVSIPVACGTMTAPSECKKQGVGQCAMLQNAVVSALWPGLPWTAYLQCERASGLRVEGTGTMPEVNDVVRVAGIMSRSGAESSLTAVSVQKMGTVPETKPVAMSLRSLGGGGWYHDPINHSGQQSIVGANGLNNVGLLVRIYGRITRTCDGYVYIDDGSHLADDTYTGPSPNIGVRVLCDTVGLQNGEYIIVTGISSCFETDLGLRRMLHVTEISK